MVPQPWSLSFFGFHYTRLETDEAVTFHDEVALGGWNPVPPAPVVLLPMVLHAFIGARRRHVQAQQPERAVAP
jgi:hypothetical protein